MTALRELLSGEVSRRRSGFQKRTPVEVVRTRLATGEELELFVKHLGFQVHRFGCPDREPQVYERLFAGRELPVPRCYGTADGLLVLEHVDGTPLHHRGLDAWLAAARSLASLHGHFAARRHELAAADFLLRVDAEYLAGWARRAVAAVAQSYPAELAKRVRRMTGAWDRVVELIVTQPATLVHNHLSPKNVVVAGSRICIVDWEMAGVGCSLEDFVHLRYQRLEPADDRAAQDAYVRELAGSGLLPSSPRELRRLVVACELQRIMYKLDRAGRSGRSVDVVAHRIERLERLWSEL